MQKYKVEKFEIGRPVLFQKGRKLERPMYTKKSANLKGIKTTLF